MCVAFYVLRPQLKAVKEIVLKVDSRLCSSWFSLLYEHFRIQSGNEKF